MALRYDPPTEGFTQSIPVGIRAFRKTAPAAFGFPWTEVVRNLDRCQAQSSEHCVCRACDNFENEQHALVPISKGRKFFEWCVKHADALGIQAVIFNRRVWGFGDWTERHYSGDSPHTDHVHIGFNKWAAANLTVEMVRAALSGAPGQGGFLMALTDAEQAEVLKKVRDTDARTTNIQTVAAKLDQLLPNLAAAIAHELNATGAGGGLSEAQIEAACARALGKTKLTVT